MCSWVSRRRESIGEDKQERRKKIIKLGRKIIYAGTTNAYGKIQSLDLTIAL